MSDRLYQDITDICAKHAGVTKPQVDELAEYVAAEVDKARREAKQELRDKFKIDADTKYTVFATSKVIVLEPDAHLNTQANYKPKFDEKEFNEMVRKGTKAWKDVKNPSEWVEEQRGNTQESEEERI